MQRCAMTAKDQRNRAAIPANSEAKIIAAADNRFLHELPDKQQVFATGKQVTVKSLKEQSFTAAISVFDQPDSLAAVKTIIAPGTAVSVLGVFKNYYLISAKNQAGWIKQSVLL